jgi:uncharacterized Zn-binding protein involved in type VI secretion
MGRLVAVKDAETSCLGRCQKGEAPTLFIDDIPVILKGCDFHSASRYHPDKRLVVEGVSWFTVNGREVAVVGSRCDCNCPIVKPNQSTVEVD